MDSAPPSDIPPREGLYSTPLSWERPQPGLRMDTILGLNTSTLNEAEQRRLIAIAMNPGPSMGGLGSNLNLNLGGQNSGVNSGLGTGFGASNTLLQPTPSSQSRPTPPTQTRQSSIMEDKGKEKVKPGDRTAHNDIERKYRTNLKDKISELRSAVPSLQTISEAGAEGEESPSQPARAPKVSKVSVAVIVVASEIWKRFFFHVIGVTELFLGHCPDESNGLHPLPREEESANRARTPGALPAHPGIRTVVERNSAARLPDAELQPNTIRPKSLLLIPI